MVLRPRFAVLVAVVLLAAFQAVPPGIAAPPSPAPTPGQPPSGAGSSAGTPGTTGGAGTVDGGTSPAPGTPAAGASAPAPAGGAADGITGKEKQVLERIRQLKTPRWRPFGVCRYDWGAWKLSEAGVRFTAVECGDPPVAGSIAVHCDTLRVNRRVGDGPWETWRLPLSAEESKTNGGEDRMVAALCANVPPAPASGRSTTPPSAPPVLVVPAKGKPAAAPAARSGGKAPG